MTELNLIKIGDLPARGTLVNTDKFLVERADGENRSLTFEALVEGVNVSVGAGEVNTGSNLGTGAQVYEGKNGTDLRFRTLTGTGNGKITVTQNANTVAFNVDENQFQTKADLEAHKSNTSNPHNVTAAQLGNTVAQWNAYALQGRFVSNTAPTTGQSLVWNGTTWAPGNPSGSGVVNSVNGQTGDVVLNTGAIAEGSNLYYTDARVDARITAANLASNASLSNYVTLATDQTVTGTKTFSTIPVLPTANPTLADQATRKGYVDGLDSANVKLTGAQTIAGAKTFSSNPISSAAQSTATNALTRKDYVDGLDGANVKVSGAQTIAGVKTFSSTPVLPAVDPTTADEAARKAYVDTKVSLNGSETIAGTKTFSSNPISTAAQSTATNALTRKDYVDGLDGANVKLSGDQAVAGIKTFSSIPVLPASDPTTANQATRKSYVDTLDGANVKLTGAQTVGGVKTFSSAPLTSAAQSAAANSLTRRDFVEAHTSRTDNPHNVTAAQVGNTTAQWNANQLQGRTIGTDAPSEQQVLMWEASSSSWKPKNVELAVNGLLENYTVIYTTTYNVTAADNNKLLIATVSNTVFNLPDAATVDSLIVGIQNRAVPGTVSIQPVTSPIPNDVSGKSPYVLDRNFDCVIIRSNGMSTWDVISEYKSGALPVDRGGTGATTPYAAQRNLQIPFSDTEVNTSNRTLNASDNGKIFFANTGSNNVVYTLPNSSTVSNGYTVTFIKNSGNGNMHIDRAGSDMIGGLTRFTHIALYASVTLILRGSIWYVQSNFNGAAITPP